MQDYTTIARESDRLAGRDLAHEPTRMTLTTQLAVLKAGGLIRLAQLEPEIEYLFRHALIQEAAY
jgi:hypothetical protein